MKSNFNEFRKGIFFSCECNPSKLKEKRGVENMLMLSLSFCHTCYLN